MCVTLAIVFASLLARAFIYSKCPDNFLYSPEMNSCYFYGQGAKNTSKESKDLCAGMNASLIEIDDLEEP